MIDDKANVELILKVQVPHMGIVKTLRTNTGHKVHSLKEALAEKLETAEKQDFSQFGIYWYSETGPLWLAENSFIRAYGLKSGDTLQYKQKPTIVAGPGNNSAPPAAAAVVTPSANSKKSSSPFLSAARFRTVSSPQIVLPSLPSSPSISTKSPKEGGRERKSTKDALLKAFHLGGDNKQAAAQVPPPPSQSHPPLHRPISVSTPISPAKSFNSPPSPLILPFEGQEMQKSMSTPSPTTTPLHRSHSATAPPKPLSQLTLTLDDNDDPNVSPRKHSPLQPHTPGQRSPPTLPPPPVLTPPVVLTRSSSHSNPPLPRMPSQLPPLYRGPTSDPRVSETYAAHAHAHSSIHVPAPPSTPHACGCTHNTAPCEHREELDRASAQAQKMTQRMELTECILTDTLQAIEDGEADLQAVKMYLQTALASLKREEVAQIQFGK